MNCAFDSNGFKATIVAMNLIKLHDIQDQLEAQSSEAVPTDSHKANILRLKLSMISTEIASRPNRNRKETTV